MIKSDSPNILKEIVEAKKLRLKEKKKALSLSDLEKSIKKSDYPLNFSGNLMSNQMQIIAEIKKGSPSKGAFNIGLTVQELAEIYSSNGASATTSSIGITLCTLLGFSSFKFIGISINLFIVFPHLN